MFPRSPIWAKKAGLVGLGTAAGCALMILASCAEPSVPAGRGVSASPTHTPSYSATASPTNNPTPAPTATASATPAPFVPAAHRPLSRRPRVIARDLTRVFSALEDSIHEWVAEGHPSWGRPPHAVVLQALYEQRILRLLVRRDDLAARVLPRLDGAIARATRTNVSAGRALRSLTTPVEPPVRMKTQAPEPAGDLLRYYEKAQRRFRVDWEVLASINSIETRFGRIKSASYAGAQGPMQFIPSTWDAYGMGGDVHDPHDAIMGAANYLRDSGAPHDYPSAIYAYNHAWSYVRAVRAYAREMERDPFRYFAYYNWQVFVSTTRGDLRLTGPGR